MFVRVRLAMGTTHKVLFVPESAIAHSDPIRDAHGQERPIVFVLTDQNIAERRDVDIGPQEGNMRIITKGLTADDHWVVTSGVDKLKPGMTVVPEKAAPGAK